MKNIADLKSFSERLAWARTQKNMTQQELADATGMRQSAISALESSDRPTSRTRKMALIGQTLGVNPNWLSTGRGDPYYRGPLVNETHTVTYSLQRLDAWETEFMNLLRPLNQERKDTLMSMVRMMHPHPVEDDDQPGP